MIDEKKMKREIQAIMDNLPEGTIQKRIYGIFLEYINRQPLITLEQIRFEQRMAAVLKAAGRNHLVMVAVDKMCEKSLKRMGE